MTQYKTDFSEYTNDAQPSDWTERFNTGSGASLVRAGAASTDIGAKYLETTKTGTNTYLLSWDDIDADSNRANCEILVRCKTSSLSALNLAVWGRGSGAAGSENGYHLSTSGTSSLQLRRYSSGGISTLKTVSLPTATNNTYFWMRLRINGSSLKAKRWLESSPEPDHWDIEVTNSDISAAGWVGIEANNSTGTRSFDFFSVGTNGDAAPWPDVDTSVEGRATQNFVEALTDLPSGDPDPEGRVTQLFIEVLRNPPSSGINYELTTPTFQISPVALTVNYAYGAQLTTPTFQISGVSVDWASDINFELTTPTFQISPVDMAFDTSTGVYFLSSPVFQISGEPVELNAAWAGTLTTSAFTIQGGSVDIGLGYAATLTTPTFQISGGTIVQAQAVPWILQAPTFQISPVNLSWQLNAQFSLAAPTFQISGEPLGVTLQGSLKLQWAIGQEPGSGGALGWAQDRVYGGTNVEDAPTYFNGEWNYSLSGETVVSPYDITTPGAISTLGSPSLSAATGVLLLNFVGDYYYRIWVVPDVLNVLNPRLNVPVPFSIWNAYPWGNTLNNVGSTGATGLTLDFSAPLVFGEIEYKQVNITISTSAPNEIDANFTFTFDDGEGYFQFLATIAHFVQMVPDVPVVEYWEWLTDIIISHDSTEQRLALRGAPRRRISYSFPLEDDTERRRQYQRWYKSLATRIILPYYQYGTVLTQTSAISATKIFFDPARTDVRDGESVIVLDKANEEGYLLKLDTVEADGATLDNPLTQELTAGWVMAPAFTSRLKDGSGPSMLALTGNIRINAEVLDVRTQFSRPGSAATLNTYDGYNVLDRRPLANEEVPENFFTNYEVLDNQTGVQTLKSSWPHPFISGQRQFLIQRYFQPAEMDWWRDFCDSVRGQQNPFLLPTYRHDLVLGAAAIAGTQQLVVAAPDYETLYFPYETYKRLQIETANGTLWRKVLDVADNGDGTQTLELDQPFGLTAGDADVLKISYLNLCRLGSDQVRLTHGHLDTFLDLSIRTIDA